MEFVVAATGGTHLYRAPEAEKPVLLKTLPPVRAGLPRTVEFCEWRSCLALLLQKGTVGVWHLACDSTANLVAEIPGQFGPLARCYFSPRGSCIAVWEPIGTFHSVEQRGTAENQKKAFTNAQNLVIWSLQERGPAGKEFSVEIEKDGTQRLGVNVDHEEGYNGLLVRRVDDGLVATHNKQATIATTVVAGDRIISVNGKERIAQSMAEEIQRAQHLSLSVRRCPLWSARPLARFFTPSDNPLRWPPLSWSATEQYAFRCVTNEILVLDGSSLKQLRRIAVDSVLQMSVAQTALQLPSTTALAVFCPGSTSASPSMVRVFSNIDAVDSACGEPRATITKSFFFNVAWVTIRWDLATATDAFVLVHSSDLTEADVEGRTLHGHGGNGLYLVRTEETTDPITALSGFRDGAIFDAQWCPTQIGNTRQLVLLQGPQPALLSVVSYKVGSGGGGVKRVDIGRFGVRNCLGWDLHGRSFSLRALSLGGAGVSNEAETIDFFDVAADGTVSFRSCASTGGKREKEQTFGVGLSVQSADFAPNGKTSMVAVGGNVATELKFCSIIDGNVLYRLKFEEILEAVWTPSKWRAFPPPDLPAPPTEEVREELLAGRIQTLPTSHAVNGLEEEEKQQPPNYIPGAPLPKSAMPKKKGPAPKAVNMEDKEAVRRRVKALQKKVREIERLRSLPAGSLDALQQEKLETEASVKQDLAHLEKELDLLERAPVMVFDVETATGVQHIEYRRGDDCIQLAVQFCQEYQMGDSLVRPLAEHMEQCLRQQPAEPES